MENTKAQRDRQSIVLGERTWETKAEQIVSQEGEGGGEGLKRKDESENQNGV